MRTYLSETVTTEGPDASLMGSLAGLTRRQQAAVLLRHHYGLSTRETAQALRCREGTVKSLLARAREALTASMTVERE
jgi:DNA-directed RNA polymerase specialized sigma24 family protein